MNNIELMREHLNRIKEELSKIPNKERDWTEYRKIYMKLKYRLNTEERERQLNYSKKYYHTVAKINA